MEAGFLPWLYYQVDKLSELQRWKNVVYLWRYFSDEKYGSIDYKL